MSVAVQSEIIKLNSVKKVFQSKKRVETVLSDISFSVSKNEFLVILGPGQCGKTTLLNIMADLETVTSGEVLYTEGTPKQGELGFVFQKYGLLPWKNVFANVELGLMLRGVDKETRRRTTQECIELVGLKGFEKSLPKELSGGMKQRVGIARAYACGAEIMFMDEPFGALDAQTRYQMENEITRIWETDKKTIVFVTNNVEEAITLGDRILLMTGKPSVIKAEFKVDLPRPRNNMESVFLELRNRIAEQMDMSL